MKKYIKLAIIILLFTNKVFSQLPVLSYSSLANPNDELKITKNGNYAQDTANERDQYVGIWEYNQDGVLFQVKMEKIDQYLNKNEHNGTVVSYSYCDVITFKYKLIKNGVTIYDNLNQDVFPVGTYYTPTAIKKGSGTDLYGSFYDATRNAVPVVSITRLNTAPAKITFKVYRGGTYLRNPREYYDDGQPLLTIPSGEFEMVKIN